MTPYNFLRAATKEIARVDPSYNLPIQETA